MHACIIMSLKYSKRQVQNLIQELYLTYCTLLLEEVEGLSARLIDFAYINIQGKQTFCIEIRSKGWGAARLLATKVL